MTQASNEPQPLPSPAAPLGAPPAAPTSPASGDEKVVVVAPTRGFAKLRLRDLWDSRELLFFLSGRDIRVRYKQTVLGAAWAVFQPVSTMLVFSVIFGRLMKVVSDGVPYPLFAFAGLVPWVFFQQALNQSAVSLIGSANLLTKVYFPRLIIPIAAVFSGIVDLACSLVLLFILTLFYRVAPSTTLLWLPLFLLMAILAVLGSGLWFSALYVQYRDIGYILPFLAQLWMFSTPVFYPSSLLPGRWQLVYGLNPMTGVVEGVRYALLHARPAPVRVIAISAAATVLIFLSGLFYFRRMERRFADLV